VETPTRSSTRCAYRGTARPAGGQYCPTCGRPDAGVAAPRWRATEVEVSVWTAMKAGFGLAAGSALFALFLLIVLSLALLVVRR
jgi:hypothetical protein